MKLITNHYKNLLIFGIPLLIIGLLLFVTTTTVFTSNISALSTAITVDLLLTVPIVYFLLIRKTSIPKTTILPFILLGMILCTFIIPPENQQYLRLFKTWIFPIIELFVISYVLYNLQKTIRLYKQHKNASIDFFTALKNTCEKIIPKALVVPLVTEIAVFYYGFIYWKKRRLTENEFSYHKNSGSISLLIGIIFIVTIEMISIHILVAKWNITIAWVLTFLSVYSGFQIFGFLKSMLKRPIIIDNDIISLKYGIMCETTIAIENIESIKVSSKDIELSKEVRKLSFLGQLEAHNVVIKLKNENTLKGLYGIKKKFKTLALFVDEKDRFVSVINSKIIAANKSY